jgi:arsenate reductase-like glutaredoxin family protein
MAIASGARRFLVKAGREIVRLDAPDAPLSETDAAAYLLHEDGFLRVPVLLIDDLCVRGFTEDLYREALETTGSRCSHRSPRAPRSPSS